MSIITCAVYSEKKKRGLRLVLVLLSICSFLFRSIVKTGENHGQNNKRQIKFKRKPGRPNERETMQEQPQRESDKLWPKVLECRECGTALYGQCDGFFIPCCDPEIVCDQCLQLRRGLARCGTCKKTSKPTKMKRQFFGNIERAFAGEDNKSTRSREINGRSQEEQAGHVHIAQIHTHFTQNWLNSTIYETHIVREGSVAAEMTREVYKIMTEHKHAAQCYPYQNIQYLCETTYKLKCKLDNDVNGVVTIHDILAFLCMVCGHGPMNRTVSRGTNVESIRAHIGNNCNSECCGTFLDRRYLQYAGGNCECGVIVMERLGIRPAREEEHKWRKALYEYDRNRPSKKEIKKYIRPLLTRMNIERPQMMIWYIQARGYEYLRELQQLDEEAAERRLFSIYWTVNGEYGVLRPVR